MTRNGQFHPIRNFSNLFPPKWLRMTWNCQFCPIPNFSNLFPPKWLRMTQNGQICQIHNFSNLFPPKWLRMTQPNFFQSIPTEVAQNDSHSQLFQSFPTVAQNDSEWPILPDLQKWLRMTRNCQFCPICNFSNLFPPKWLRMTQNGQICQIHNFSNLFPPKWPE